MGNKIILELEVHEALLILDPIQDRALTSRRQAAEFSGAEQEIADVSAKILTRVLTRLTDLLYPDQCRWMDEEECDRPIEADGLCSVHFRHRAQVAEILA